VLVKEVQSPDLVVERPPSLQEYILDIYVPFVYPDNRAMHETGWVRCQIYRGTHVQAMWPLEGDIPFGTSRSGRVALGDKESDGGKGLAGAAVK